MIIRGDKGHTVATLTAKMHKLIELGLGDTGFPVLVKEESLPGSMAAPPSAQASNRNGLRVVGFLGLNELAHALCKHSSGSSDLSHSFGRAGCTAEPHTRRF